MKEENMNNAIQPPAAGEAAHIAAMLVGVNPKYHLLMSLVAAAESAEQWLCEAPKGSDQYERGCALRGALNAFKTGPTHAKAVEACNSHARLTAENEALRERLMWYYERHNEGASFYEPYDECVTQLGKTRAVLISTSMGGQR